MSQTPRRRQSGDFDPLQPVLEESPELRFHTHARARVIRRVASVIVLMVLVAAAGWIVWYALSLRNASSSTQSPMRADRAASGRLTAEGTDLTLLVVRPSGQPSAAVVAVLRQPEAGTGSWLLVLPTAPIPTSDAANETPGVLLTRGRASLMKALETLLESPFRHYLEVDGAEFASALVSFTSTASQNPTGASVPPSSSPSSTVAALVDAASEYDQVRNGSISGLLRLPRLAGKLSGVAVSDLSATEIDVLLRRLGADESEGHLQTAVVPVQRQNKKSVVSVTAAGVFATRMLAGQPFGTVTGSTKRVAPGSVSVTVLNGAGREGVAAQAARILRRAGYPVKAVGNANQFVYDKTLVVYDGKRSNAESVVRDLRLGRIVASRGMYAFDTDVLVIVGSDWPKAP